MANPCPPRKDFLIGWMSSRDVEVDAASATLDEEFADFALTDLPPLSDSNHYIAGRISNHNVVLICFPPGDNPQVAAAIAATSAKFTFPSLQHVLLVGVASGIPHPWADIRLGDIVTGTDVGVISHDITTEQWPPIGQLKQPNTLLRNVVRGFRATSTRAKLDVSEYLQEKVFECENLQEDGLWRRSHDLSEDKLFPSSVAHTSEGSSCYGCRGSFLRPSRDSRGPELFSGLVLSGNFIMRNGHLRDRFAHEFKAICWDREAIGVMTVFPALVVRGIEDYGDAHSSSSRAAYGGIAAARAAIFAKELLKFLPKRAPTESEKRALEKVQLQEFIKSKQLIDQPRNPLRSQQAVVLPDTTHSEKAGQIFCLWGDDELPIDPAKKASAAEWFNWLSNAHNRVYREVPATGGPSHDPVKIAILDTGIELSDMQKDIYDLPRTMQFKSWLADDIGKSTEWSDDVGHGTHLATLLAQVAQKSIIHVARVFKNRKPNMDTELANVSRAIRYSVDEWHVDIIVMSFGFEAEHDEGKDSILPSIRYAADKGVALFAAASNDGKNRLDNVSWPARAPEVICVHSGDGLGSASPFTPPPGDHERIMVLGECVLSAWPERLGDQGGEKYMSGTSCAAPIAAGIAALVLDYAKRFLPRDEWRGLLRTDRMQRLFERMAYTRTMATGYWWIRPWDLLGKDEPDGWIIEEIRRALR